MLSRKNQRQKLKREKWLFSFARVAAGTVLDSIWDFPSQTDMVLLTSVEAIFAVCVDTVPRVLVACASLFAQSCLHRGLCLSQRFD